MEAMAESRVKVAQIIDPAAFYEYQKIGAQQKDPRYMSQLQPSLGFNPQLAWDAALSKADLILAALSPSAQDPR